MDVALVDVHDALRDGLEILLERRGVTTVGTTATAAGAREIFATGHPDVAVVGIHLRDGNGLDLVRELQVGHAGMPVLIYTGIEEVGTLAEALESGARGFLLKLGGITQLIQALRLLARGEHYVDPTIRALLDAEVDGKPLLLTKRQREIFDLLAHGLSGKEIAERLGVSAETVRTHVRNGMEKLQAHTRTGAVVQALHTHEIAGC
jgi:DNA-binding NarL/FixJ family response regulator